MGQNHTFCTFCTWPEGDMTAVRSIDSELRAAVCEVTAAYNALPSSVQVRVGPATRDGLDGEVCAADAVGDPERALAAIRAWRGHWLTTFEGASR